MKKAAVVLRIIFLTIAMIAGLVISVTHSKIEFNLESPITLVFIGASGLYILIAVIAVIVRLINRGHLDETELMLDTYVNVLDYNAMGQTLNYFRTLSFWGAIMLVVNIFVLKKPKDTIIGGPYSNDVFLAGYHGYLLWSLISLVVMIVLSIVYWAIFMPHYGTDTYNIFQYVGKILLADISAPFRIIKSLVSSESKSKIISLATMIVFIVINVIAVLKSI